MKDLLLIMKIIVSSETKRVSIAPYTIYDAREILENPKRICEFVNLVMDDDITDIVIQKVRVICPDFTEFTILASDALASEARDTRRHVHRMRCTIEFVY